MITSLQLIKDEISNARQTFEGTVADVTSAQTGFDPGGKALPLGAIYAHLILSEDFIVQGGLMHKATLAESTFKGKTGISAMMPAMDNNWAKNHEHWAKTVKIDLPKIKQFSQAVYSATDQYVNSLKDEDLTKEVDLGPMGKQTIAHALSEYLVAHMNSLTGEISALKGIQGAKGYPF
jgi:hypothetical protein